MSATGRDRAGPALPAAAVVIGLLWLVVYAAAAAVWRDARWQVFESDVLYAVPDAVGIGVASWASRQLFRSQQARSARAWRWVAVSCALRLVGDVVLAAYYYLGGRDNPFPSAADPLWILSGLALIPAVLYAVTVPAHRRRWSTGIDALVAALGLDSLLFTLVVGPDAMNNPPRVIAATIGYPVVDLVVLVVLLCAVGRIRRTGQRWMVLLVSSVGVLLATDLTSACLGHRRGHQASSWLDLGWQLAAVLLVLAALVAGRAASASAEAPQPELDRPAGPVELPQLEQADESGQLAGLIPLIGGTAALLAADFVKSSDVHVERSTTFLTAAAVVAVIIRVLLNLADQRAVSSALHVSLAEQQRLAITDMLTDLYNRRFIEELLVLETLRASRDNGRLAIILFDLDHFKAVNDGYGHQAGDAVLVEAALRFRRGMRSSDVLGRWGGEEFLLVLRGTDEVDAVAVAERARSELEAQPIVLSDGRRVHVSVSAGVSCMPPHGMDADSLLWQADQALYAAKEAGRNRVLLAGSKTADHRRP